MQFSILAAKGAGFLKSNLQPATPRFFHEQLSRSETARETGNVQTLGEPRGQPVEEGEQEEGQEQEEIW